jgi:uncharacterized lipoprotein
MHYFKVLLLMILALVLVACSTVHKREKSYAYLGGVSKNSGDLQLPPDLKTFQAQPYYPIPPLANTKRVDSDTLILPPGADFNRQKVKEVKKK